MSKLTRPVFDFSGKTVLVTGGTSGMGAATVDAFAHSSANVVFAGRSNERAQKLLEQIRPLGGQAHFIAGDTTADDYCQRLVFETLARLDPPGLNSEME